MKINIYILSFSSNIFLIKKTSLDFKCIKQYPKINLHNSPHSAGRSKVGLDLAGEIYFNANADTTFLKGRVGR